MPIQKVLKLSEITQQLNIDQFIRLSSEVDVVKLGAKFDVVSVRPYRTDKDENRLEIEVIIEGKSKTISIAEEKRRG